ncbi:MAG TPA: hypothetical protein VF322_05010 [Gammaproteobacteria bacterium]
MFAAAALLIAPLGARTVSAQNAPAEDAAARAAEAAGWVIAEGRRDSREWAAEKQRLQELGEQFGSADALYEHFLDEAGTIVPLTYRDLLEQPELYDWRGVWTRASGGLQYDPDVRPGAENTAQLTPAGRAAVEAKIRQLSTTGGEYDPISDCRPPGMPRWLTEPFLREFTVAPHQTWLINEMVNDIRRVYTDGREHTAPEDAYPSWNGDSVGFWDGGTLIFSTKYLMSGQYQRGTMPNYSDQVEVVERWRKTGEDLLEADVWVYDPVNLAAPWYTRQAYRRLSNEDNSLRIRYWDCRENPNNDIIVTDEGTSQFPDFTFVDDDAEVSNDPNVRARGSDPNAQAPAGPD